MKRILLVLVTALFTVGLGWLARAPYDAPGGKDGLLRLSWRLRGERAETCRLRTQAELDALPVHMRTPEICEGRLVAYRLIVQIDGTRPDTSIVLPGGARGDRPLYVMHEMPLAVGPHRIRVSFGRAEELEHAVAPLSIDAAIEAAPGSIDLITLNADANALVHRSGRAP